MPPSTPLIPIAAGESGEVMRLGDGRVLKLFRADVDEGIVRREYDGARRAVEAGLLVSRPLGREQRDGRLGILFEEIEGPLLLDAITGWNPLRARAALRGLADCQAAIHRCDAGDLIHHQHDILWVRILSADIDEPLRQAALEQIAATPRARTLCHGDLHPGNAIIGPHGIAAVDWSSGCAGDPAADVVRTELLLRYGQMRRPSRIGQWLRHRAANLYLARYRRITGIGAARLAHWRLPVLLSGLGPGSTMYRPALLAEAEKLRGQ